MFKKDKTEISVSLSGLRKAGQALKWLAGKLKREKYKPDYSPKKSDTARSIRG